MWENSVVLGRCKGDWPSNSIGHHCGLLSGKEQKLVGVLVLRLRKGIKERHSHGLLLVAD